MKRCRSILIASILLAIMLGFSGCMKSGKPAKEEMLEFMKNKYNEEFEFVSIGNEAWNANYTEMIVHSEKFPEGRIVVRKSGHKIVDNYTDFLMKEKMEKEMSDIVAAIYPESKVFYDSGGMPMGDEVNPSMSITEYSKAMIIPLSFTICIIDSNYKTNKDNKIEELRNVLESKEYRCKLNVFYVKAGKLNLINDMNINELYTKSSISDWIICEGRLKMDNSYKFNRSRWTDTGE